jgi:hypothetical protein
VHRQQDGEAPRVSVNLDDPESILDRWNSHTSEERGGGALGGDRLKQEGTPERFEQISREQAEMNARLQEQEHISEHQGQYDGSFLGRYNTRSAESTIMLHRMDVEDASTGEKYTMDPRMAINEMGHNPAISNPISPKTGTQPIQDGMAVNDQCPASNDTMDTRNEASRNASVGPATAAPASTNASSKPPQVSVLASDIAQFTDSIPTEMTKPVSTHVPMIPPTIPASHSPCEWKEAVPADTKPPLDVLVVDDDK